MNTNAGRETGEGSVGTERSGSSAGFSIVVAMDKNRGIGKDGGLPWPKLKGDMKFFRELTTCPDRAAVEKRWGLKAEESGETKSWDEVSAMLKFAHPLPAVSLVRRNIVIMGRKTYESLPEPYRPLPDRDSIVLTRSGKVDDQDNKGMFSWPSLDDALSGFSWGSGIPNVLIIGGGEVFAQSVPNALSARLYITEIDAEFPCDTFFPETPGFRPVLSSPWIEENGIRYRFRRYDRV